MTRGRMMVELWFFALLRVGFVLLGAWGAGRLLLLPVRREGIWGKSVALTMGVGLALRMLLQSNAVMWVSAAVPWIDGLFVLAAAFGAYDLVRKLGAISFSSRVSELWQSPERGVFFALAWILFAVFVATLRFPEYSDAYFRSHFLVIEDMLRDGHFDDLYWTFYYGYAIGAMALFSTAAKAPVLYDMQIFHYGFLLLSVILVVESGRHFGLTRRASLLAGLLAVTILEVVVISRNPAYDMVVHFFQLAVFVIVLDLRSRKMNPPEIFALALMMFAALSAKLYGAIGVGMAGLFGLFWARQSWRLAAAGVLALVCILPAMAVIDAAFHSPLFPYMHDLYGGGCAGPTVPYELSLRTFLLYPFELTFRFDTSRLMAGPVFLAVLPLLFLRRGREALTPELKATLLFGLFFMALWFWLPFTSQSIRFQLFALFLLTLPAARFIDTHLANSQSAAGTDRATKLPRWVVHVLVLVHGTPANQTAPSAAGTRRAPKLLRWAVLVLVLVHVFPAAWYSSKKSVDTFFELRSSPREGGLEMLRRSYPWLVTIDETLPPGATVYTDIGDYEPLRHRRKVGTFLKDQGRGEAQSDYVVLLTSGTDSYLHCMTLLLTDGHPERYETWKESIRRKREYVTTVEGRYEIYR